MSDRVGRIRAVLEQAFSPRELRVVDDSHRHAGHAGAAGGGGHYTVEIVADAFAGVPLLARHRLVYGALGALMRTEIHALSISARAPGEATSAPESNQTGG